MTIDDMIAALEEAKEILGGEAEVRLAVQPSWPLRHAVAAVTVLEPVELGARDPDEEEAVSEDDPEAKCVWIAAEQGHPYGENPYAPRRAWDGNMS